MDAAHTCRVKFQNVLPVRSGRQELSSRSVLAAGQPPPFNRHPNLLDEHHSATTAAAWVVSTAHVPRSTYPPHFTWRNNTRLHAPTLRMLRIALYAGHPSSVRGPPGRRAWEKAFANSEYVEPRECGWDTGNLILRRSSPCLECPAFALSTK